MTTLSIALATYNGARFLPDQLLSLARQVRLPDELVVTDDGSTDDTLRIIDDFARTAPFGVRVHRNPSRAGYRANFINCASLCAGDLIAFCDQDDVWLPEKLERQSRHFDDPSILLSCHNAMLVNGRGERLGTQLNLFPATGTLTFERTRPNKYTPGFTEVIRRDLLRFNDYFPLSIDAHHADHTMAHDAWFFFLALLFGSVMYDSQSLSEYRQHDQNASGTVRSDVGKLLSRVADRKAEYQRLVKVWGNRAQILAAMLDDRRSGTRDVLDKAQSVCLEAAHERYLALTQATERRFRYYAATSLPAKLALFARACIHGDFRTGSAWHYPVTGALRDLSMLLVPGRD